MNTYGLEKLGIIAPKAVYRNLSVPALVEKALQANEGTLSETGALVVNTGKYTGRSPDDKFVVDYPSIHDEIAWGKVNVPMAPETFDKIYNKMTAYLQGRDIYIFDGFAGVFPMHCSANIGADGDTALFFGLSGTGKTTLSADPERMLIGDDEHGWSDNGVFNFEGGCYAKCINLSKENEPQISSAIKFGALVENVVMDPETRVFDFNDGSLTENTRVGYPVEFIPNAAIPGVGGQPKTVVFLTADAFGVLPPIAKLDKDMAMFHFVSGYTSKLAGTERGITEPQATFSTCFGAPFLPLDPSVYAEMLGEKVAQSNANVYLINTGWSGGSYGVGKRMSLKYTRAMVTAALTGALDNVKFELDPIFNVYVPTECPNVPAEILNPKNTWADKAEYDKTAKMLAARFTENFKKYTHMPENIVKAGPKA